MEATEFHINNTFNRCFRCANHDDGSGNHCTIKGLIRPDGTPCNSNQPRTSGYFHDQTDALQKGAI